jgi:hypothetical protein
MPANIGEFLLDKYSCPAANFDSLCGAAVFGLKVEESSATVRLESLEILA